MERYPKSVCVRHRRDVGFVLQRRGHPESVPLRKLGFVLQATDTRSADPILGFVLPWRGYPKSVCVRHRRMLGSFCSGADTRERLRPAPPRSWVRLTPEGTPEECPPPVRRVRFASEWDADESVPSGWVWIVGFVLQRRKNPESVLLRKLGFVLPSKWKPCGSVPVRLDRLSGSFRPEGASDTFVSAAASC